MRFPEFPLILSPNLGCPRIVELRGDRISVALIIAGKYGDRTMPTKAVFQDLFKLIPSYRGEGREIDLVVSEDPVEIADWNQLSDLSNTEDTQALINSELHYKVLGKGTQYWKVNTSLESDTVDGLLREREVNGEKQKLPTLYDLVMAGESGKYRHTNYHAVQFVEEMKGDDCNFLHLTDAHVAKRNDEMLDEVVKVKNKRSEEVIRGKFINFNDNFRKSIRIANEMADKGELDFVLFTGDLVDQAFHGWKDEGNDDENNFKEFIDIVTGRGREVSSWKNEGLKVALFTSTGNHDWRLHPYDPGLGRAATFGLKQDEVERYLYKSFDASEYPEDGRAQLAQELSADALTRLNLDSFNRRDRWAMKLGKLAGRVHSSNLVASLARFIPGAGIIGLFTHSYVDQDTLLAQFTTPENWEHYIPPIAVAISFGIRRISKSLSSRVANLLVDNPLHAEAKALHYYFTHINPYLDYAFSYGNNHFILMDSGSDAFVGDVLDGKERRRLKRLSMSDNFIGGSPDSRAFDSEQLYCNWSQIVWLEKVLQAQGIQENDRVFIGLHAPPINVPNVLYENLPWWQKFYSKFQKWVRRQSLIYDRITSWEEIWESHPDRKIKNEWIAKRELDLTYGTINHYVSQFFYLCLGLTEAQNRNQRSQARKKVTMVLAGHAHRNIEFSIDLHWNNQKEENEIRIFSDAYSNPSPDLNDNWKNRPLMIQTAGCGPTGAVDKQPPYYRKIEIQGGEIKGFRHNLPGVPKPSSPA